MKLVTPAQIRAMDQATISRIGIPGIVLMERASLGAVSVIDKQFPGVEHVAILCGSGNNGGDGLAIARLLAERGVTCRIGLLTPSENWSGDALTNLKIIEKLGVLVDDLSELEPKDLAATLSRWEPVDLWCDALLGTGIDRDVTGRFLAAIDFLNSRHSVFAVDIPSGLNGETGQPMGGAVLAHATASFGAIKIGQVIDPGRQFCGQLHSIEIGIPAQIRDDIGHIGILLTAAAARVPPRAPSTHKGQAGRLLLVGGAPGMGGAIAMTARAALASGAGLVRVATHPEVIPILTAAHNELMTLPITGADVDWAQEVEWADVVVIGPGMGTDEAAREQLTALLEVSPDRLVLDADALNMLANSEGFCAPKDGWVLTPHPGEMARLCGTTTDTVLSAPLGRARELAAKTKCTVVSKSRSTIVVTPEDRIVISTLGNPGMATAGMGDILAGILGASLCDDRDVFSCVTSALFVHGHAGDAAARAIGERGLSATDLLSEVPAAWRLLESFDG
jgi:ADP-dependent NAD(P)H-hydrate dehydratase / NAD(P)H-hydrate epimerase